MENNLQKCAIKHSFLDFRQAIIKTCRNFKVLFHEARERASKALSFAKMLRKVSLINYKHFCDSIWLNNLLCYDM